jgi:murein DD-endopeptidase / murein LD-carboxypeptidase
VRYSFLLPVFVFIAFNLQSQDSIALFSKKFLGTPYRYATASPKKGFDCSGFVNYVFSSFQISVPRTSQDFMNTGKEIHRDSCRAGDIIVFTGTKISEKKRAGHVGIVLDGKGDEIQFIHSSSGKKRGVIISSLNNDGYKKRFLKVIRVTE